MGFDEVLLQQLTSIGNVVVSKHFNFEDRVINTSVNILLTSLLGITLGLLIDICFKGGFEKYKKRFLCWWNPSLENPLEFEPDLLATSKKEEEHLFRKHYAWNNADTPFLYYWFYKYHIRKDYKKFHTGGPFLVQSPTFINEILDGRNKIQNGNIYYDLVYKMAPIWNDKHGVVYFSHLTMGTYSFYSDSLSAITNAMDHLEEFKKEMGEKYNKNMPCIEGSTLWEFRKKSDEQKGNTQAFSLEIKSKISAKHTFDYLHFTQKKDILGLLEKFKEGTLYPLHIPMDNKMGILLHGPPGTGKTRFIAAVANYLERGVALINFTKVKTCSDFDDVISKVLEKNLILVLDEIDTMKGVLTREGSPVENKEGGNGMEMNPYMMMLLAKEKESSSMMANEMRRMTFEKDDELTLGHILSKLDGLESCKDLLIIATTNHPERIDPALTRPGRLGFQLHLSKCTHQMLHDILHMIFPETSVYDIESAVKQMPADYYAPAYVIQNCIENITFEKAVEVLKKIDK
jgi:hypothetical protein